jgi:hypothetical protein
MNNNIETIPITLEMLGKINWKTDFNPTTHFIIFDEYHFVVNHDEKTLILWGSTNFKLLGTTFTQHLNFYTDWEIYEELQKVI